MKWTLLQCDLASATQWKQTGVNDWGQPVGVMRAAAQQENDT